MVLRMALAIYFTAPKVIPVLLVVLIAWQLLPFSPAHHPRTNHR